MSNLSGSAVVIHGGGPTPVINASLAGLVLEARNHPEIAAVLGVRFGVDGLLSGDFIDLSRQSNETIEAISWTPGSALGSCRRGLDESDYARVLSIFAQHKVRWVFYNGGNGTMYAANALQEAAAKAGYNLRVVGIPKTIDNDLAETDHTPGYGSAARFVACATRDIGGDLWSLRERVTVVETMGRNVGWIVAAAALARHRPADPPHLIYLPERPVSEEQILSDVSDVYSRLRYCVVAVCEGQTNEKGEPFGADAFRPDGFARRLSANLGHSLAQIISNRLNLRARSEKPGLLGRSSPYFISPTDREEAVLCGRAAVQAAIAGQDGNMVTLQRKTGREYRCTTGLAPLLAVAYHERRFPEEWIHSAGNDVSRAFLDWVRPLAGPIEPRTQLDRFD